MSQNRRIARLEVIPIVKEVMKLLEINTVSAMVCGSIRRNKETVGDVDIVVQPQSLPDYLDMLDEFVHLGYFGRGVNSGGRETWGDTKRLLTYKGINFDVIIADEHQLGYKLWLSTGPSMANTAMMVLLKEKLSPVRMADGYMWHVSYSRKHPKFEKQREFARLGKLHVPDEETFFKVIGMAFCHPQWRSETYYKKFLWKDGQSSKEFLEAQYVEGSKPLLQTSMF